MFLYLLRRILNQPIGYYTYIWQDVILVAETPKAILIIFDDRKEWIPKAWIYRIKRKKGHYVIASPRCFLAKARSGGEAISIKISEYRWAKKFA